MLFHVTWSFGDRSEDATNRGLAAFAAWQPPEGADFQGFYSFADGSAIAGEGVAFRDSVG